MPYPYFYGVASRAIAPAEHRGDWVRPVGQPVATGEIIVPDAVEWLQRGTEYSPRAET